MKLGHVEVIYIEPYVDNTPNFLPSCTLMFYPFHHFQRVILEYKNIAILSIFYFHGSSMILNTAIWFFIYILRIFTMCDQNKCSCIFVNLDA